MDIVDHKTRSRMMSGIQGKNTRPEVAIRRKLFAAGYRYRLYVADLPGKPDIVLSKFRTVIFIQGCFWHHHNCALFRLPQTRTEFWKKKLEDNRERDKRNVEKLLAMSWRVILIYECTWRFPGADRESELNRVIDKVTEFLHQTDSTRLVLEGETKSEAIP